MAGYTTFSVFGLREGTLVKTDENGKVKWSNVYGNAKNEVFTSVREVPAMGNLPEGYIVTGYTSSQGYGENDMLLLRTDLDGNPLFVKTYGGTKTDVGNCIQLIKNPTTGDYEYIMAGSSNSYSYYLGTSVFVVKTDIYGKLLASVVIGGSGNQSANWIEQTSAAECILVGSTNQPCTPGSADNDIFVIKLKFDLFMIWNRIIGDTKTTALSETGTCVKENKSG